MVIQRSRERLLLLLTLSVGALLAGLVGEAVVRVAGLSKTLAMRDAAARQPPASGGLIGGRYEASRSWIAAYGVSYRSNAAGFRDRDFSLEKPAGVVRIAILGDSVAEGLGVPVEERFSTILEEQLNQRAKHEVLNFARAGYSTLDELEVLRSVVLRYGPQQVVLQLCFNDLDENAQKSRLSRQSDRTAGAGDRGIRSFLQARSALYLFFAERYNGLLLRRGIPNRLLKQVLQAEEAHLRSTESLLGQIATVCREAGIAFVVAYVPLDAEVRVSSDEAAAHFESLILSSCERIGARFIPTLRALRNARDCQTHIDDSHLSPCGHRVIARTLAGQL